MGQMFLTGALGTLKLCVSSAFLREQHLDSVYREIYFCLHGQEEGRSMSEDLKGSCSHRPLSSLGRIQKLQGMKCLGVVERLLTCDPGDLDWVRASVSQDNCGDLGWWLQGDTCCHCDVHLANISCGPTVSCHCGHSKSL